MITKKQWHTFTIAALILGAVMVAAAIILLIVFQHSLGTQASVEKLCAVLAIVGGGMIGVSLKRLTIIKEADGTESDWYGENGEENKRIEKMASRMAEICWYPLLFAACIAFILFIEPIWGLSLLIAEICVLKFILYRCLIVWYRHKNVKN